MDIGTLIVTIGVNTAALDKASAEFLVFEKTTVASINRVSQRFRTIGYLMSAAVTLPIVAAGKASFKMAEDFEFSMQKIVGLAGVGQKVVDQWRESILKMAPELSQTPQALADALYFIASSGIKGAEALDVLQLSAKAATSGLGDTKIVADFLTSALNAYKGTGLTAAAATDILTAAVREGKAEASGFSSAMGSVIPIAALLNVSLSQVAGAMAAITLSGSTAAQAATYLKGMFNNLMKGSETGKGAEALRSIQSSYAELRDILKNGGIIPMLEKVREGMTKYGDTLVAKVFPNIRAMTGILSIAGKNFEYNSKIMKEVTNSTGSLGKAFAAISDTIKVRFDKAISTSQTLMISLGKSIAETILPILESLVKRLSNLITWFNSLTDAQKKWRIEFALFLAIAGPAALIISVFGYAISGLATIVSGLKVKFIALNGVVLANPWVLLAVALVGAGAWLLHYTKKSEEAAIANDKFNTTLIDVNGSLKKMKDLTTVDYSSMGIQSLIDTQNTVRSQLAQVNKDVANAYKMAGVSPEDAAMGKRAGIYTKYIDIRLSEGVKLKNQYDELNTQITKWTDNFGKAGSVISDTTKLLDEQSSVVDKLAEAWSKAGNYINDAWNLIKKGMNKDFWTMMAPPKKENVLTDYLGSGAVKFIGGKAFSPKIDFSGSSDIIKHTEEFNRAIDFGLKATPLKELRDFIKQYQIELTQLGDVDEKAFQLWYSKTAKILNLVIDPDALLHKYDYRGFFKEFGNILMTKGQHFTDTYKLPGHPTFSTESKYANINNQKMQGIWAGENNDIYSSAAFFNISPSQYHPVNAISDLLANKNIKGIQGTYSETAKIMEDLGKELEFVNMKSNALGITMGKHRELFDGARAKVNAYSKALEDYLAIPMTQRGSSWQKQVDDTIANLEKMQAEFDKIQRRRDFLNGIKNAFSSFFMNMMSGTKSVANSFKEMVNSIIQSFEKMIADMIAKKLIGFIMNAIAPGVSTAMSLTPAYKLGEGLTGMNSTPFIPNLSNMGSQTFAFEPAQFTIKDNTLTAFMKKASKKNNIY